MYARSTTVHGDPRAVDAGTAHVRRRVWPAMAAVPGCIGMSMLADRYLGRCIITTAWDDADAMRASTGPVRAIRQHVAEVLRADRVDVEEWEIAVLHRERPAGEGACVRLVWSAMAADELDDAIEAFRMSLLPRLDDLTGFCSLSLLVDRAAHRGVTAITYADRRAMEAAVAEEQEMGEEFAEAMGLEVTEVAEFDLVVAHLRVPELV
ncbi:hypothetical protein [Modestobacter sp. NPDC049651]|uniref:hypothetical protein n=1 Tax=unclassified Modestobacter TaxID=2643866 RepID=UPI0033F401F1